MSILKRGRSTLVLVPLAAGLVLGGCAGKQKKKTPPPPPPVEAPAEKPAPKPELKKVKAGVTSADHTGAAATGQPKITIKGEAPDGYTIQVTDVIEDKKVTLSVWAIPPEGATEKGANKAYEHVHVMKKMEGGPWKVHVLSEKNTEVKFLEFSY